MSERLNQNAEALRQDGERPLRIADHVDGKLGSGSKWPYLKLREGVVDHSRCVDDRYARTGRAEEAGTLAGPHFNAKLKLVQRGAEDDFRLYVVSGLRRE